MQELHTSFQATDPEATGVIGRAQFTAALQHVSTQFKLGLTAEYIGRVHREADALYNGRIDYNEFLSKHAPGKCLLSFVFSEGNVAVCKPCTNLHTETGLKQKTESLKTQGSMCNSTAFQDLSYHIHHRY